MEEAGGKLIEAVSSGERLAVTLKESDGISYRDGKMLLSRVGGLFEAKLSCPSHGFVFKQLLRLLDIP